MNPKKIGTAVLAIAAAGAVVAAAANANADTTTTSPAASSTYSIGQGKPQSNDTPVTGDELTKVTAAVTAKDSGVTVTSVQKDPDGSYDVFGTKDGAKVMYEVSADLATITQNTGAGGAGGGPAGGRGGAPSGSTGSNSSTTQS